MSRKQRLNRRVFSWNNARSSLERSQQGGCSKIRSRDVPKPFFTISLILLWLSPTNRPRLCRSRKIRGDDSDPPQKRGPLRPQERRDVPRRSWPPRGSLSSLFIPAGRPGIVLRRGAGRKETDLCNGGIRSCFLWAWPGPTGASSTGLSPCFWKTIYSILWPSAPLVFMVDWSPGTTSHPPSCRPSGPSSWPMAAHRSVRRRYPSATAGTPRCL